MKSKTTSLFKKLLIVVLTTQLTFPVFASGEVTPTSSLKEFISGVYTYLSGMLVMRTDENGNRMFFDRGRFRYSLDKEGNLLAFAAYGTDKINSEADLVNLISKTTGKSTADVYKMLQGKEGKLRWLSNAVNWLAGGTNRSISIDFSAEGGATCTFSENGRALYAKAYDGETVSKWVYNSDGSIKEVWNLQYEPAGTEVTEREAKGEDGKLKNGYVYDPKTGKYYNQKDQKGDKEVKTQDGKTIKYNKVWSVTTYSGGKADKVYEIGSNNKWTLVGSLEYASNGELIASYDYKNNEKTIYSGGKPIATVTTKDKEIKDNEGKVTSKIKAGSVVRTYKYDRNGAIDTVSAMDKA
ncbi:MAG: hypothetical protein QME68_08725, partial [Elusimicrobiota bacterium]|nr:hypothetical protein [Elusimicrobiota bacterium]